MCACVQVLEEMLEAAGQRLSVRDAEVREAADVEAALTADIAALQGLIQVGMSCPRNDPMIVTSGAFQPCWRCWVPMAERGRDVVWMNTSRSALLARTQEEEWN